MDTFRLLKYWKTHGVFPVNACSTPRMTITSTIPTTASRHTSPTNMSPDEDHRTTIGCTRDDDDDSDGENERRDEFFNFTEPIDLYFKANEESRSSAVKSAMKIRELMLKLKKSKGDGTERMELDDPVLNTSNQKQRKSMTAELRVKEVTRSEKQAQTPDSLNLVRTPSYRKKDEVTMFEKLVQTPASLRLRTPSYRNEEATMFEKLVQTPGSLRLRTPSYRKEEMTMFDKLVQTPSFRLWTPRYQKKEDVANFEGIAQTPGSFRLAREVTKSDKRQTLAESGPNETRFSTDLMQKYLKRVKPMYIGVSNRYNEKKLRLTAHLRVKSPKVKLAAQLRVKSPREMKSAQSPPSKSYTTKSTAEKRRSRLQVTAEAPPPPVVSKNWKQGNLAARLRGVGRKQAGKGRPAGSELTQERRRDDSVLEKEDGIRSAILHCKRSFNGSRDAESMNLSENCSEETKETGSGDGRKVEIRL